MIHPSRSSSSPEFLRNGNSHRNNPHASSSSSTTSRLNNAVANRAPGSRHPQFGSQHGIAAATPAAAPTPSTRRCRINNNIIIIAQSALRHRRCNSCGDKRITNPRDRHRLCTCSQPSRPQSKEHNSLENIRPWQARWKREEVKRRRDTHKCGSSNGDRPSASTAQTIACVRSFARSRRYLLCARSPLKDPTSWVPPTGPGWLAGRDFSYR